jgi:SAM-dependent methyltransferase
MPTEGSDKYWQTVGEQDPYWGVITADKFRKGQLTEEAVDEFYSSGEVHVAFLFDAIGKHLDEHFTPASGIDFGCGVGRILLPLAKRCGSVVGVDVSDGMLERAKARAERVGLANVRLVKGDDELSGVTGPFDLVHSYIVFQHIPTERGFAIAEKLVSMLKDGGVGILHFLYFKESHSHRPRLRAFLERVGLYRIAATLRDSAVRLGERILRRPRAEAEMMMNTYDLNSISLMLQRAGVRRMHVEYTDHDGCYGLMLFFKKQGHDWYRV